MPVRMPALFSDHAVLQRDRAIPVWGWADPGEHIRVAIAGTASETITGDDGCWQVLLPALPAGGPYLMSINDLTLQDVLVGEVWVCSGQSNMEMYLESVNNAEVEIAAADFPGIRHFDVGDITAFLPQDNVTGVWQACTPATAPVFTAAGYFFARALWQRLGIPVGLLNASWGGSAAEAWISRAAIRREPVLLPIVTHCEEVLGCLESADVDVDAVLRRYQAMIPRDEGNDGLARGYADPTTDDSNWPSMELPQSWQQAGLRFSGVFWFRREVVIPPEWSGRELTLRIGACDKSDVCYFNGVEVGCMSHLENENSWCTPRCYAVPGTLVKAGKAVIAVRIFSHQYAGGMLGPTSEMYLHPADTHADSVPLAGAWRYVVEKIFGKTPPEPGPPVGAGYPNLPGVLYNGMIAPLIPYAIRGALWYQGESNAERAREYRTLFPAMIRDWRARWGQGNFPFYYVQLANFMAVKDAPSESEWAELREAQMLTLREPDTGMAVIIDAGDAGDIHPKNKQAVGERLALLALARVHGCNLIDSGPLFRKIAVERGAIRVFFDTREELVAKDGRLSGFAIAGADRRFTWAEASIDGDTVLVSSPQVPDPVAIRYAWADNPTCTLCNAAGLPASPFRSDDWPVEVVVVPVAAGTR